MAVMGVANAARRTFPTSTIVSRIHRSVKNWYESGWPLLDGGRAYIPQLVQDARWDQNYITRREILRRMRFWECNSGLLESILSVGERYTVGPAGLHVSFYPSDDASMDLDEQDDDPWYEAAELVTREFLRNCGWNGESFETMLKVGYRRQKVDGDVFYVKTWKNGPLKVGNYTLTVAKPCLQMVEAHRVETPFNRWDQEGHSVVDGVEFRQVKLQGRDMMEKVGYHVRAGFGAFETESRWFLVPIEDIIHVHSSHRVNQFRGLSDFYSVEGSIGKLYELLKIELSAQNEQSQWSVLVKNASGQFNPIDSKLSAVSIARGQSPNTGIDPQKLTQIQEMYRKTYGANTRAFKFGEDAEMKAPIRPSEATLQLWEYLINDVCAGCHSPRSLVMGKISAASAKSQGTEVRAELDSADAYYKGDFQKWKRLTHEAVEYFMEWAINNDPRVADPPANWRHCIHVPPPEACNVDVGRNTQADLMMLAAGAMDYDMLLGPQGISFNTMIRRLHRQQSKMKRLGVLVTLPALMPGQIELNGKGGEQADEPGNEPTKSQHASQPV